MRLNFSILMFGLFVAGLALADLPPLNKFQAAEFTKDVQTCFLCHGTNGSTGSMSWNAPRLAGQTAPYLEEQIKNFVSQKRNNPFSRQNMWGMFDRTDPNLYPYIAEYFSKQVMAEGRKTSSSLVSQGKDIYMSGLPSKNVIACKFCHGMDAKGNGLFPRLAGQDKYYLMNQLYDWQNNYRNYAVPMPDIAKELNDQEINAVTEFLSSLK